MEKVAIISGAGISKASGVPTFEEMGDLRDSLSRQFFRSNPQEFYDILITMQEKIRLSEPNDAHKVLAEYEVPVVTMNIDGLHTRAGSKNVVEIHGNLEKVLCHNCKMGYSFNIVKENIKCPKCRGVLEPNVVLYGDMIPRFHDALVNIADAQRLLVIGTSFYTSTVCDLVARAKYAGIKVDIINERAEVKVREYLEALTT